MSGWEGFIGYGMGWAWVGGKGCCWSVLLARLFASCEDNTCCFTLFCDFWLAGRTFLSS